jgi:lipopolysaccharide biosynthesis protein
VVASDLDAEATRLSKMEHDPHLAESSRSLTHRTRESPPDAPRAVAFYLPQYHPIPDNDRWWGKGFTEWTNVVRARPQFRRHYQPHLPADLGFYDLRLPEARQAQADLAAHYGIGGFCYYHYWFEGQRLLHRPFDDVLCSAEPDLPFFLCWANESWSRRWDGGSKDVLIQQRYSHADDLAHIRWLAKAFADPRYLRVERRPLLLVYRAADLPDPRRTTDTWRQEAVRLGVGDLYLGRVESVFEPQEDPRTLGFDAAVEFQPHYRTPPSVIWRTVRKVIGAKGPCRHRVISYKSLVNQALAQEPPDYPRFPGVCPAWDNTARRSVGATIFHGSSPDEFARWIVGACNREHHATGAFPKLLFVNAWNEWAEGNHLEPCQRWGLAYLEALREGLANLSCQPG